MKITNINDLENNYKEIGKALAKDILNLARLKIDSPFTLFDIKVKLEEIDRYSE